MRGRDRVVRVGEDREQRVGQSALDPRRGLAQLVARGRERFPATMSTSPVTPRSTKTALAEIVCSPASASETLPQDRLFELLEPNTRLDPRGPRSAGGGLAVRLECLRLATRAVEREHQLGAERLAHR